MGGVEDVFFITQVQRVLVAIVSLDVVNALILDLNNVIQMTDVEIQFLN